MYAKAVHTIEIKLK